MTTALSPRCRAVAMPGASALLEMTTLMRALGMRPASMLSAMATKFDPRPERSMPRDFIQETIIIHHGDTETRRRVRQERVKEKRQLEVKSKNENGGTRIKRSFSLCLRASVTKTLP